MTKIINCDKLKTYLKATMILYSKMLYKRIYGGYGEKLLCSHVTGVVVLEKNPWKMKLL